MLKKRLIISLLVVFATTIFTIRFAIFPDIYFFATDPNLSSFSRLLTAPIHLNDDVMISLRSGFILNEIGIPAFNRTDLAQASTSYLAPYLFSLLLGVLSSNLAVLVYAIFGFVSILIVFITIIISSKSLSNAIILVAALCFTDTHIYFALNGWDHLFQSAFLSVGAALVLHSKNRSLFYIIAALSLALGTSARPDGIIISSTIVFGAFVLNSNRSKVFLYLVLPFVFLIISGLTLNYIQFHHFTPTTARLKIGASPSIEFAIEYLFKNGLMTFSALTLVVFFLLFCILYRRFYTNRLAILIIISSVATALCSAYNSDFFRCGRMYWSAACVMAVTISVVMPKLINIKFENFNSRTFFNPDYNISPIFSRKFKILYIVIILFIFFGVEISLIREKIYIELIKQSNIYTSATAQQYRIAKWFEKNLDKNEGAIGFYYLGVSYHLPTFEVADFLGKADEMIAQTEVKWGPPGHNKWDTDKTLSKWNLQAIIPSENSDPSDIAFMGKAKIHLDTKQDFGFKPDLLLNKNIHKNFVYCYLRNKKNMQYYSFKNRFSDMESPDKWGFFLRRNLANKYSDDILCSQ